jgi:hypothetical protein
MTDVSLVRCLRGIALVAFAAIVIPLTGCASTPMSRARTVIGVTAEGVIALDRALAPGFAAATAAQATEPERFQRYGAVVTTLLLARMAIMDAEVALDAIEVGGEGDVGGVIACVVEAVQNLIALLPSLDVNVPDALVTVMSMASAFAGTCGPGHAVDTSDIPHASEAMSIR